MPDSCAPGRTRGANDEAKEHFRCGRGERYVSDAPVSELNFPSRLYRVDSTVGTRRINNRHVGRLNFPRGAKHKRGNAIPRGERRGVRVSYPSLLRGFSAISPRLLDDLLDDFVDGRIIASDHECHYTTRETAMQMERRNASAATRKRSGGVFKAACEIYRTPGSTGELLLEVSPSAGAAARASRNHRNVATSRAFLPANKSRRRVCLAKPWTNGFCRFSGHPKRKSSK